MVFEEKTKLSVLQEFTDCPADIPASDADAWPRYKKYNWIYNRLVLAQLQGIESAPMPIPPKKYPVVLKPIINLYGGGLNVSKIGSEKELADHQHSNNFWMEFLEGDHLSFDILLLNGKIQWHCCFKGYKMEENFGSFTYWESLDLPVPDACHWIIGKLDGFTGCINLELIGDKIIEGHLRLGDSTKLPDRKIMEGIVGVYRGAPYDFPPAVPKIYLFPIWTAKTAHPGLVWRLDKNIINTICGEAYSYRLNIDTETLPGDLRRIMLVSAFDYETGANISRELYQYINGILQNY